MLLKLKKGVSNMLWDDVPAVEDYHQKQMDAAGMSIEEYCNVHGYEVYEILEDPQYTNDEDVEDSW